MIDVSKEHPVRKNLGLYRVINERDVQTGKLKRLRLGFISPNPLSMGCAILDSSKHNLNEIMRNLSKLRKEGVSAENIVTYLDTWFG